MIILRTFLQNLRHGRPARRRRARPARICWNASTPFSSGALPITGVAAATASLKSPELVPTRRKIIADIRGDVFAFLDQHGFRYVPSVSNSS